MLEWEPAAAVTVTPLADTTFVLVHGFSDLSAGWAEVAPLLAAHAHVIAPDLRGHGDSDRVGPGGYYHFLDYVADLDDVIRQLARARVVLVGHSMGGMVSGYYAGTRPERIAALAVLEGLGPPDAAALEGPQRTASWIDAWRAVRPAWKPMESIEIAIQRLRKHDPLLAEPVARRLAEAGTRAVAGGLVWKHDPLHATSGPYAFRVELARAYWARIAVPVLVIDGGDSRLNLGEADRASRRASFRDATHLVIPAAGHALQRHQPAALTTALLALAGNVSSG